MKKYSKEPKRFLDETPTIKILNNYFLYVIGSLLLVNNSALQHYIFEWITQLCQKLSKTLVKWYVIFWETNIYYPNDRYVDEYSWDLCEPVKFPNYIRCMDDKHAEINCPAQGGSTFYKHKQFFWILLQAVADNNFKRITVDTGAVGRWSDDGNFRTSSLYVLLERRSLNITSDSGLPGTISKVPFVLLGDEGNPLLPYFMRL